MSQKQLNTMRSISMIAYVSDSTIFRKMALWSRVVVVHSIDYCTKKETALTVGQFTTISGLFSANYIISFTKNGVQTRDGTRNSSSLDPRGPGPFFTPRFPEEQILSLLDSSSPRQNLPRSSKILNFLLQHINMKKGEKFQKFVKIFQFLFLFFWITNQFLVLLPNILNFEV